MGMTDAELEDFLSFMGPPAAAAAGGGGGGGAPAGGGALGALAAFAAHDVSDGAGSGKPHRPGGAHATSSSDANGSSEQPDSRMVEALGQRSPQSSDECTGVQSSGGSGALGGAAAAQHALMLQQHQAQHQQQAAALMQQHGQMAYAQQQAALAAQAFAGGAPAPAAPMAVPGLPRAASLPRAAPRGGGARGNPPDLLRAHSVQSLGSLTMPLEGLALGSPAVMGALVGADGADGASAPTGLFGAGAGHGMPGFGGAPVFGGVSMGAFGGHAPPGFVPAVCGSAPPCGGGALASSLDTSGYDGGGGGGGSVHGGGGAAAALLSMSWPSLPAASGGGGGCAPAPSSGSLQRSRSSGGVSKPPSSGGARGGARSRGATPAAGAADFARGGGGAAAALNHSAIEKQRRDRLNALLDDLGTMVPPSDGRADGSRRPKHVILSDAITLLSTLQAQLRLGCGEIAALRMRLAAADAAAGSGGAPGVGALDIDAAAPGGGAQGVKQEHAAAAAASGAGETGILPPTPGGTSPAELAPGSILRCASSDADFPGAPPPPPQPTLVVVEQEGACVRVAVRCADRDGLLGDLAAALKATGATIAKASITTLGGGGGHDEFELRLADAGGLDLGAVRAAVLGALGAGAAGGARGKRTRQ